MVGNYQLYCLNKSIKKVEALLPQPKPEAKVIASPKRILDY